MTIPFPVFVLSPTPRDIVIARFLAVLAQSAQTINHGQIVTVYCDAEFMVCVCGHCTSQVVYGPVAVTRRATDT